VSGPDHFEPSIAAYLLGAQGVPDRCIEYLGSAARERTEAGFFEFD
jgi:hypothetical protein